MGWETSRDHQPTLQKGYRFSHFMGRSFTLSRRTQCTRARVTWTEKTTERNMSIATQRTTLVRYGSGARRRRRTQSEQRARSTSALGEWILGIATVGTRVLDAPRLYISRRHSYDSRRPARPCSSADSFAQPAKPPPCACGKRRGTGSATETAVGDSAVSHVAFARGVAGPGPAGTAIPSTYASGPVHRRLYARVQ